MKIHILPAALAVALLFAGCSGNKAETAETSISEDQTDEEIYRARTAMANSAAREILEHSWDYAVQCAEPSGKLATGRYCGHTGSYIGETEFTGRQEDMEKYIALNCTGYAADYYYAVMIDDGVPAACYTSDRDLSSMDFSSFKEPDKPDADSQVLGKAVADDIE